ncbi:KGGVGR-motif variant AAA ATPase [Pedobacter foliorum]|uniref:KGGVGR-motif variant AAA ATPase n=1 Tax=Pedobacter foliorum TaxID=2739058 RepID=UPI0015655EFE|nr:AAA family ATPase [Pedobacter foliorum]NRF37595.1 AAA family ATPase [Pedobacter foliorum]
MIKILHIANKLNQKLAVLKDKKLIDYKISIRLNFEIDVYVIEADEKLKTDLAKEYNTENINFSFLTKEQLNNKTYLSEAFESGDSIDYGLKYRFDSLLSRQSNVSKKFETPIVTFYSYKGGLGRSTTMTSYAMHLASIGKKVCIIDCDFEAPGYLNFFNFSKSDVLTSGEKNGVVEFLADLAFQNDVDLKDYIISPVHANKKYKWTQNIFVVPAGNLSDSNISGFDEFTTHRDQYLDALSKIDFGQANLLNGLYTLIKKIETDLQPDVILIDSRTGFNDIFAVTALMLSNLIVGFFGSSEQTKPGLRFLIDKFYELNTTINNRTDLILINSILPKNQIESDIFHDAFVTEVGQYVQFIQERKYNYISPNEQPKLPSFYKLGRNSGLEKLGISRDLESTDFDNHLALLSTRSIEDYNVIFNALNESKSISPIFSKKNIDSKNNIVLQRNLIIKNLRATLRNENGNPVLFAEDAEINPNTFFYREQMSKLFDKDKFIIQGFKGTGKTYLYKALRDQNLESVREELLRLAGKDPKEDIRFIDIISLKGTGEPKSFDFDQIQLNKIENKRYYFKNFWLVYTWNSIFLDATKRLGYKAISQLNDFVKPYETAVETKIRFDMLITDDSKLAIIEQDLLKLDSYLNEKKITLFVLYDQLDNLLKPSEWQDTVSPLIDYWWDNFNRYKNISPKIFIRTDLYGRLVGTNTARLENNIIKIEWSREEVYAYFFKLIFSNKDSFKAMFDLMKISGQYEDSFFKNVLAYLKKNNNQLKLLRNEIEPFIATFFGKEVYSNDGWSLGKTYDWFYFNLTNADQKSISLRPFINLINGSLDNALVDPGKPIPPVIKDKYFASRENRDNAVIQHFRDLIREDFNQDLEIIFNFLRESGGNFKQIFLTKSELNNFLNQLLLKSNHLESKNIDELKSILISNGIIHENIKPDENIFYFAQLYKYWLGLRSRKYEFKRRK